MRSATGREPETLEDRRQRQGIRALAAENHHGDAFYPGHHQTYTNCLIVASELALQAYEMVGAPACPPEIAHFLPRIPVANSGVCPICKLPMEFSEFDLAVQSKAAIDTDHLNPGLERRHAGGNVAFVHHECNTTKGDRSLEEFEEWMFAVLKRHGYQMARSK